jgi:hypothetical protein
MALHRDIHWIGRQWAVTGHGMQLIDQKLQGFFDIEIAGLWDESLIATMHAKQWLNAADFDKGLSVARARFPQSMLPVTPSPEAVSAPVVEPIAPLPPVVVPEAPTRDVAPKPDKREPAVAVDVSPPPPEPVSPPEVFAAAEPSEPQRDQPADLRLRFNGNAKFLRPWRVWMKRQP